MEYIFLIGFWFLLSIAAIQDIRIQEVKEWNWIGVVVLAIPHMVLSSNTSLVSHVIGAFCVSVPILLLVVVIPNAFGGGDIKMVSACGLFLGAKVIFISMLVAILMAGVFVILRLLFKRENGRNIFPFIPFLCGGMIIGSMFAQQIIDWYLGTLV